MRGTKSQYANTNRRAYGAVHAVALLDASAERINNGGVYSIRIQTFQNGVSAAIGGDTNQDVRENRYSGKSMVAVAGNGERRGTKDVACKQIMKIEK